MGILYADVIVDLQYGDTGKGKVAHTLAKSDDYNMVLRYNGGANAGHTVYHNGTKVVTHQVPVGVLYGKMSVIGPGCVVNVQKLRNEISELNLAGFNTDGLILVDKRAHVVQDKHLDEDGTDEKIGTTRQGIGPTYRDKYGRTGMRMGDILLSDHEPFVRIDIYELLYNSVGSYKILCEGAQGFHLDIDWGKYPYVTSSHCTVGSACLNGISPKKIRKVIGIMKAYETYVGNRIDYTEERNPVFEKIREIGDEYGATTGRPRKINWLNMERVIQAINVNGVTDLIINKADVLKKVSEYGCYCDDELIRFGKFETFKNFVEEKLCNSDTLNYNSIIWSMTPNGI